MKGVCLTGNRPQKIPFAENSRECEELKERLRSVVVSLIEEGYTRFISGMALGSDIWFAECVLSLKDVYPDIELEAAVPYIGQSDRLAVADRFRYDRILRACNEVTYVSDNYTKYCMNKRNRYMVDHASHIIALYDGVPQGGTAQTLAYAMRKGLTTDIIPLE